MIEIGEIVTAYLDCGKALGFFHAEEILMRYVPVDNPDGKCCDVPPEKFPEFLKELNARV